MTTFAQLGLRDELVAALSQAGITEPFPVQERTIPDALAGRDVCGKARTGSGKTLAFGLPLLQRLAPASGNRSPRALVLAPTRELASQILDVLRPLAEPLDLDTRAFYGGTDMDRQIKALRRGTDVAVATPGRLIDLIDRGQFDLEAIEIVVVDEADRMADMGFLPQVEWILRRVKERRPQVLLFSATLDGDIDVLVRHYLHDPVRHEIEVDDEEPHDLAHRFLKVHEMDRVKVAATIVASSRRTIIFTRTKRMADRLVPKLAAEGVKAAAIHGDLPQRARERALAQFTDGQLPVLVATDVAARGIHVDDIDVVIHFDPPEDHKGYVHRSGRTARAGSAGVVVTFVLWNQELEVERLQRRLGIDEPLVEIFSNDPRLRDLQQFGGAGAQAAAS